MNKKDQKEKIRPELVCPAGTPGALRTAVDAGADTVYCGFRDETNARNFPGLNFNRKEMEAAVQYAHDNGSHIYVAINTYPQAAKLALWHDAIDDAVAYGADAIIVADLGLAEYVATHHPKARLHLSVQASASTPQAIDFYAREFGVKRVVLPRVLTVPEIAAINKQIHPIETEAFVFGGLCVMAEGRCMLSSYATGKSPNMNGVCSPASHVHYEKQDDGGMKMRLGDYTLNCMAYDENTGYPTTCKGRYVVNGKTRYVFDRPSSLNAGDILVDMLDAGIKAFKIEGRQRSRAYVGQAVTAFRKAVDDYMAGQTPDLSMLVSLTEGQQSTQGAYDKTWS